MIRPDPQLKERLLDFIRNNHTPMYRQWFVELEPIGVDGGVLTILVKQDVHRRYLENKAIDTFQEAAQAVTGRLLGLKFIEESELESPLLPAPRADREAVVLSPDLTFDQFVVGSNNQLANAASVAEAAAAAAAQAADRARVEALTAPTRRSLTGRRAAC